MQDHAAITSDSSHPETLQRFLCLLSAQRAYVRFFFAQILWLVVPDDFATLDHVSAFAPRSASCVASDFAGEWALLGDRTVVGRTRNSNDLHLFSRIRNQSCTCPCILVISITFFSPCSCTTMKFAPRLLLRETTWIFSRSGKWKASLYAKKQTKKHLQCMSVRIIYTTSAVFSRKVLMFSF